MSTRNFTTKERAESFRRSATRLGWTVSTLWRGAYHWHVVTNCPFYF